jgi:hypothetical protein
VATSGTISTTIFNTGKVIDTAYRYCRLPASAVSGEMIETAKQQLYLMLSSMANTGVPLWCQSKEILPMYINNPVVPCPAGTVDVLNANLRTLTEFTGTYTASEGVAANAFDHDLATACVQAAPAGFIELELDTADTVTSLGLLPGAAGNWDVSFQYSDDGSTWITFEQYAFAAVDRVWNWLDIDGLTDHQWWRLKANGATVLNVVELVFANNPQEIPVARLNKDDYFYLPNKQFAGRPVQYWLDRKANVVNMNLWPSPNSEAQFQQLTILRHRHIMDVGTLQNILEIPQRWFDAICAMLARRLAYITPEVKVETIPVVEGLAQEFESKAWMEERDDSPFYLQPNVSVYTR